MLYVTGGLAYAKTERSVDLNIPILGISETFSSDKSRLGWTAGFGTEWQFASNWSLKSEVLYARFQTEESLHLLDPLRPPAGYASSMKARHGSPRRCQLPLRRRHIRRVLISQELRMLRWNHDSLSEYPAPLVCVLKDHSAGHFAVDARRG